MRAQTPDPYHGDRPMRFYNAEHRFYCGVDLHARMLALCILDAKGLRHGGVSGAREHSSRSRRAGNGPTADPSIGVGRRRRADAHQGTSPMQSFAKSIHCRETPFTEEKSRSPFGVRLLTSEAI
jgi:hypothetical protein